MRLFGTKVVKPWSSRGYKGSRRAKGHQPKAYAGKHRKGSGILLPGKRVTPRDDLFSIFRWR